jgi:hypothetical protein
MKFSYDAAIDAAPDSIDLGAWLFAMTDAEYLACSPGHRAMGINGGSARLGVLNVESVGGALMIQHYRPEVVRPDHVKLVSDSSQAYLLHILPARIRVLWEMQTFAAANGSTRFRCFGGSDDALFDRAVGVPQRRQLFPQAPCDR